MAPLAGGSLQCTGRAGMPDIFESVYRACDEHHYAAAMGEPYRGAKRPELAATQSPAPSKVARWHGRSPSAAARSRFW